MTFKENLLLENINEALRIVKKGAGKPSYDKRQSHIDTAHDLEIKQAKDQMAKRIVGVIDGITIIKSPHSTEVRDGELTARDAGIENEFLQTVFKKIFKKNNLKPGRTMVSYKNKKGKYDLMAIAYDKNKKLITIITIIKKGEKTPFNAFSRSQEHKDAPKTIIESAISELLELNFVPEFVVIVE